MKIQPIASLATVETRNIQFNRSTLDGARTGSGRRGVKGKMIEAVEDGIDFIHKVGVFVSEGGLVDGKMGNSLLEAIGSGFARGMFGHGRSDLLLRAEVRDK